MFRPPIRVPYGSWRAVSETLDHLTKQELPDRLDNSAFPPRTKQSTSDQVRQSLQQLGLIDGRWKPQPRLDELLRATEREAKEIWLRILRERYKQCFEIGWGRLTASQFSNFLEQAGAFKHTKQRAARFVRQALEFIDIEYAEALDKSWNQPQRKPVSSSPAGDVSAIASPVGPLIIDLGRTSVTIGRPPSDHDLALLRAGVTSEQFWRRRARRA